MSKCAFSTRFTAGRFSTWIRWVASASEIGRINHRMHNKLFVADNALAITGGRNIGDQYFTRDPYSNFIDLDVVAAGPSCPSSRHHSMSSGTASMPTRSLRWHRRGGRRSRTPAPEDGHGRRRDLAAQGAGCARLQLTWVPATVLADQPAKIASESRRKRKSRSRTTSASSMASAEQEAHHHFSVLRAGQARPRLAEEARGSRRAHRILTNSLAARTRHWWTSATGVIVAAAQARHRLYEVRPNSARSMRASTRFGAPTPACTPRRW